MFVLVLTCLISNVFAIPVNEEQFNDCLMPLELVIIVDSSDKIGQNVFDDIIFKTIEIVDNLKSEFNQLSVTVVNYSDRINELIAFSQNIQLIRNRLISMNKLNGQSNPLLVIEKVTSLFLRNDFDRIKMAIWLTDGNFNDDEYSQIRHQTKLLKSVSHLFIISTGDRVNSNKLKQLTSTPRSLFNINTLNPFYRLISDITNFACKRKTKVSARILHKNHALNWLLDLVG